MNHLIVFEFKYFIDTRFDVGTWDRILKDANINTEKTISSCIEIPDMYVFKIIESAAKITNKSTNQILEEFGEFVIPFLVRTYCGFKHPEWKTLDILEYVTSLVHKKICKMVIANLPNIESKRVSKNEVILYYNSHRNMCYLIRGIIKGLARHFGQKISISEENCKLNGKQCCEIVVRYV